MRDGPSESVRCCFTAAYAAPHAHAPNGQAPSAKSESLRPACSAVTATRSAAAGEEVRLRWPLARRVVALISRPLAHHLQLTLKPRSLPKRRLSATELDAA